MRSAECGVDISPRGRYKTFYRTNGTPQLQTADPPKSSVLDRVLRAANRAVDTERLQRSASVTAGSMEKFPKGLLNPGVPTSTSGIAVGTAATGWCARVLGVECPTAREFMFNLFFTSYGVWMLLPLSVALLLVYRLVGPPEVRVRRASHACALAAGQASWSMYMNGALHVAEGSQFVCALCTFAVSLSLL